MTADEEQSIRQALDIHKTMVAQFERRDVEIVSAIADALVQAIRAGGTVYLCGNGGSAADAQHVAGELVGRFRTERKGLPAVALSTDGPVLTSVANDYGYDHVFVRQVEALVRKGDVLWAFSTSGTSPNVIAAAKLARNEGAQVIAFTGRPQSELEALADLCLCAEAELTARSQEIHQLAYHLICDLVERSFTE
jgi:D-sedoheptulose 7-phosphate isomerase